MAKKHTLEELSNCSKEELIMLVLMMQGQLEALNENIEKLIEQVRLANSYRFGKHTETLDSIDGQLSFFDEAECFCDLQVSEPTPEEVLPVKQSKKKKGKREMDLKEFPEEILPSYGVSEEELDAFYGKGNWRRLPDETFKRLRHEPESWTVEVHTVEVYVGTDGEHQDEFLRGKRPKDLLRNSIVTPSLLASILNVKYVNSSALHRIEQEFERNGVNISRQTIWKLIPSIFTKLSYQFFRCHLMRDWNHWKVFDILSAFSFDFFRSCFSWFIFIVFCHGGNHFCFVEEYNFTVNFEKSYLIICFKLFR